MSLAGRDVRERSAGHVVIIRPVLVARAVKVKITFEPDSDDGRARTESVPNPFGIGFVLLAGELKLFNRSKIARHDRKS